MIKIKHRGSFKNTFSFFGRVLSSKSLSIIETLAREGVDALANNTPSDTGGTAASWGYRIETGRRSTRIIWTNSNTTPSSVPIVILLQYGHGTGTGGYVKGIDFINPAIAPVFDKIADTLWKEVVNA